MRFLLMVRWAEDGELLPPGEEAALIREHLAFDAELRAAGALVESGSLQLEDTATMVRVRSGRTSATDGPFAETKEHLAGFYAIEAKDRDEAVRIAARIPSARTGWIEVRPMRELEAELPSLDRRAGAARGGSMTTNPPAVKLDPPRLVDVEPMKLTGLSGEFTSQTMPEIGKTLWPRFIEQLQRARLNAVGNRISWGAGFHCFDESPSFQYLCAVEVSDFAGVPAGWVRIDVPRRRYAIFTHRDHVSRLGETIEAVRWRWLPASGHAGAVAGGAPDFLERYGEGFDPASGTGDLEVWYPIRP